MFSTLEKQGVSSRIQIAVIATNNVQHSHRKRELADRYAMSNIVRDKHVSAIKERAQAFVSRCAAIEGNVNVYVSPPVTYSDHGSRF